MHGQTLNIISCTGNINIINTINRFPSFNLVGCSNGIKSCRFTKDWWATTTTLVSGAGAAAAAAARCHSMSENAVAATVAVIAVTVAASPAVETFCCF